MQRIPLQPEDRAILDLEGETIAGHTCKVIRLESGAPNLDALRVRVAERLPSVPELSWELDSGGGEPAWTSAAVDIDGQVRPLEPGDPLSEPDLAAAVAGLFEQRLERDRPLWRIDVARMDDGGAALIWRIHHALADGTTCMRFARELLWDRDAQEPPRTPGAGGAAAHLPSEHPDHVRRRRHLAAFIEREFGESIHRSPFDGRIGRQRIVSLADVAMKPIHDAAKEIADATLNDAVLTLVAGGLRRWVETHHGSLRDARVRVPVSLHEEGDTTANRDSFFTLPLHAEEGDPAQRLRSIREATSMRKADHDAERLEHLRGPLAGLAKRIESSPRNFALSVSNVPGPRAPVTVLGAPVVSLHTLAEIGAGHALRVAVVSYPGKLGFGLCADPGIVHDLSVMASGIEEEAEAMLAARR